MRNDRPPTVVAPSATNAMSNERLEVLQRRLRLLQTELDGIVSEMALLTLEVPQPITTGPPPLAPHVRVRIITRDKWAGRLGTIISRHGRKFWNIRLDRVVGDNMNIIIYKADASLVALTGAPDRGE